MARDVTDAAPISTRDELVEWFASGEKPRSAWRIGTEHEKVPFYEDGHGPVPFAGERGIRALLEGMAGLNGWEPILDDGLPIGLADDEAGGAISIEPGGQFELSGAPLLTVHETAAELATHLDQVRQVGTPLGIRFLTLGMSPLWTRAETPVMPKRRYRIMASYMPKVGRLGLDMMFRTATVQVNLDYGSERDMVRKLRVALALQPLAAALFANSPFTDGRPNGFLSMRSEIWRDTDRDRTGMIPFAFEDGMSYDRMVDYALDVPMYFVKRGDTYHDVSGQSFRALMEGRLPGLPGERATRSDWSNHISTVFPEVRMKRYLEMRGSDVGSPEMIAAQAAFWAGLLYVEDSLAGAWDVVKGWSAEDRQRLRDDVPRLGLRASVGGRSLRDIALAVLDLAEAGLAARGHRGPDGEDETAFLLPLRRIADSGVTVADDLLERYRTRWRESVDPAFRECVFP